MPALRAAASPIEVLSALTAASFGLGLLSSWVGLADWLVGLNALRA